MSEDRQKQNFSSTLSRAGPEPKTSKSHWFGIAFIVIGILAILLPNAFTLAVEQLAGVAFLLGGILQVLNAVNRSPKNRWLPHFLVGVLSAGLGLLFLIMPFQGAVLLTMILAALFFANGLFRLIHSFQFRGSQGSGWSLINGLMGILIGILVWSTWPTSSVWFIGILLGIDFILLGIFVLSASPTAMRMELDVS